MMSMTCSQETRQEMSLSQRQEARQTQDIRQTQALSLRLDLLRSVRGDHYMPRAECPRCEHRLKDLEIIKGFRTDPTDTTTKCPSCDNRFQPYLVCHPVTGMRIEVAFYCPNQALAQLKGFEGMSPEEIEKSNTAAYRSALFHFGSLVNAFHRTGIKYTLEPVVPEWQRKVAFLGTLVRWGDCRVRGHHLIRNLHPATSAWH